MSTKPDDGGPAFPMGVPEGAHYGHPAYSQTGMTLRDWFAGMAMPAYMAYLTHSGVLTRSYPEVAAESYRVADAMLAARKEAAQ